MTLTFRILLGCLLLLTGTVVSAQTLPEGLPTPEQAARVMAHSRQMMNSAELAIAKRDALGLTDVQVAAIGPIRDSMNEVLDRELMRHTAAAGSSVMLQLLANPAMEIDEEAIRSEGCEQGRRQAELTIASLRTHRALAEVLSPPQMNQLAMLQSGMGMRMIEGFSRP
jgi:hypothetical protein